MKLTLNDITPYIQNATQSGSQYVGTCPVCGKEKHLYVTEKNGTLLMYCQKCQAPFDDIRKALNVNSAPPPPVIPKTKKEKKTIAEQYDHVYKNPDGSIAYSKTRTKYTDGSKKFTFHHMNGNEKLYTKPENCNCLYNLDLLEKANADDTLFIVEGEKCADIMNKHGFLTTTANGGANSVKLSDVDLAMLAKFKNKIIIPDNDEVGKKYIKLFDNVKILNLSDVWSDIEPKQDIADYITLGKDIELIRNFKFEKVPTPEEMKIGNMTEFINQPIKLFCGDWIANSSGVKRIKTSTSGKSFDEVASAIPIMPTEILENLNTGIEKIKIEFFKDKWKAVICDRVTAAHKMKIIDLANSGVEVNTENSKLLVKYIADCVSLNSNIIPRNKAVSQMGWIENAFMPYAKNIRFDGEKENKHLYESLTTKGDYETWLNCISPLRKNIYLRMAMAASFASPLIEIVNGLPFVFNLWGGTNTGKSVALMVAMSIWGDPSWGKLSRTMNSTINSMMSTAAFLRNLPYAGDELQTIKSTWDNYDKLIMCICEGVERGRMSHDKNNETRSWKCSFIFTGEEPCTKSSSGGGVKNRVIEVECKSPLIDVEKGSEIVSVITNNFGWAGEIFINHVQNKQLEIASMYKEHFDRIMKGTDTTEKQAMAMACMLIGDDLAREVIFENEESLTLDDIKPFLTSRMAVDTSERSFQYILNVIAQHEANFDTAYSADVKIDMWGRAYYTEHFVMFNKEILIKELRAEGYEFDAVKSKWLEKGYLITNSQGRYYHCTTVSGIKAHFVKLQLPIDEEN